MGCLLKMLHRPKQHGSSSMFQYVVLYAQSSNHVGADPKHYYEDVVPSDWKPETPETCTELHRRAYCGHADAVFPVLFVALVGAACAFHLLSPGLLLVALPVVFVLGLQVVVVSGQPVLCVNCCKSPVYCHRCSLQAA